MLSWSEVRAPDDPRELRKYGATMAAVLAGLLGTVAPMLRSHHLIAWPWILAAVFAALAVFRPVALAPVYVAWMRFGVIMGAITSRITLALVFFGIVGPIGLVRRRLGHDPMRRRREPMASSYREIAKYDRSGMEVPF